MNKVRFLQWTSIGLLFLLTACQTVSGAMVGAGDTVNGLGLTTGIADAPDLWEFCSSSSTGSHNKTYHCHAPAMSTLAIGHLSLFADEALAIPACTDTVWELSIDDRAVDLESFGMVDYEMPVMAEPASMHEVSHRMMAWNIVLANLKPGEHTLRFAAQTETDSYTWLVNLVVEKAEAIDISSVPFQPKS